MKTSTLLLILMLLLSHRILYSSSHTRNDFWESINIFRSDKQKIQDLENLSKDYLDRGDYVKALENAKRGLEFSVKINAQKNVLAFYHILIKICYKTNQWDTGLNYCNKALAVAKQTNDKEYIARIHNNIAIIKHNQNKTNEAIENCNIALKIYTETGNKKGIADSYNCFGHIYIQLSDLKTAFDYLLKSIKIINDLGGDVMQYDNYVYLAEIYINFGKTDTSLYYLNKVIEAPNKKIEKSNIAFAYSLLSYVYNFNGNYSKALEYQLKGLAIYEKINYKKGVAMGYSFMGDIFKSKNEFKNAIKYNNRCLEIAKEIGENYGIVVSYNKLGSNYYRLKEYEIAKQYFSEVLHLAKKFNYLIELSHANDALGLIHLEQKNYEKALNFFFKSLEIDKKVGFQFGIANAHRHLGCYYQDRAEYKKAIQYFNYALKMDEELKDMVLTAEDLLSLSENYSQLSQYKPAYMYFNKYKTIDDSLKSETHTKRVIQLEMQYEFDKKQKEQLQKEQTLQAKIQNQKIFTFSIITFIALLSILFFFVFRNYHLKQKNIRKDIELQRVEAEKKRELDQMKLHFFANISHDIRTPLTLIAGPLSEIMNSEEMPSKIQKNLELVHRNARLLNRLVDQVLDFQKLDSSRISLNLIQNDIIQFTKKITESFAYLIESKRCKLEFFSDSETLITWFDLEKLEKIIYNLIFNAIKFTSEAGLIKIAILSDIDTVSIVVKDSGIGIPPEHLKLIFERYHQVEKAKAFYKGGSGIGLAHAKELIKLHKGEITVKSKENEGSEFTLILPRNKEAYVDEKTIFQTNGNVFNVTPLKESIASSTPLDNENIVLGKGNKIKPSVLIIEDDIDMHQYIVNSLQSSFILYRAYNGAEGFDLALKKNPDLIISDIMMENMDGLELCSKIKTELRVCHIPVILLTALVSVENKITGFETGADDYITKPFDPKLLLARVQNIIESRSLLKDIFSRSIIIEPHKITANSLDEEFVRKAINIVEENIADHNFDVNTLCREMCVSRSVFYRKIKALTNQASNDFIKSIRLKHAAQLLKNSNYPIAQIAGEVGFADQKYFSTCFRKSFNLSPSDYAEKNS